MIRLSIKTIQEQLLYVRIELNRLAPLNRVFLILMNGIRIVCTSDTIWYKYIEQQNLFIITLYYLVMLR